MTSNIAPPPTPSPSPSNSSDTGKTFAVPAILESTLGVREIRVDDRKLTIKYNKKNSALKGEISLILTGDWESKDSLEIGIKAIKKGFTTENAELLKTQIGSFVFASPEGSDLLAGIKAQEMKVKHQRFEYNLAKKNESKVSGSKGDGRNVMDQSELVTTMKYTVKKKGESSTKKTTEGEEEQTAVISQLWETVKIGGIYNLVNYDPFTNKLRCYTELPIEEENNMTLLPYTEKATEPYSFADIKELEWFLRKARKENLGTLFRKVKRCVNTFYDTDIEEHKDLISADTLFTYFQDRIGKTHYIFLHGKPGTGKGAVLEIFNQLGYRGVEITNANAPNLYRLIGDLEKGQVIIIIDEANRLEDDSFLQEVLKTGYKGNSRVARMLDASSATNSKQRYYYTYCFKIIAANKLPAEWKAEGVLDRCFLIKTSPGNPLLDIGDTVEHADDPQNARVLLQLQYLRKLMFAYRLLHYSEPIPDIKIKGIMGRDAELIKPIIRLFKTLGDKESLETVKKTCHYFVKQRTEDKSDSFDASVHKQLQSLINNRESMLTEEDKQSEDVIKGFRHLTFDDMWKSIILDHLEGKEIEGERDSLTTSLFGKISKKRFAGALRALGGAKAKDSTGNKRAWRFNLKTLQRFGKSFNSIPDTIELEEQHTFESAMRLAAAINFMEEEQESEESRLVSDTSDASDAFPEGNPPPENTMQSENRKETGGNDRGFTKIGNNNEKNLGVKNNLEGVISSKQVSEEYDVSEEEEEEA